MSTENLAMSATGTPNGWTLNAGATKMAAVALPDDAGTTSISSGATAETIQEFTVGNTTGAVASDALISSVQIVCRARRGALEVADANFLLTVEVGVNAIDGSSHTAGAAFADFTDSFLSKPGGGAWSKADVDDLVLRVRNTEAQDVEVTTLYVVVTYTLYPGTARSLVTITTQIGIEVTPGTPVPATRFVEAVSFMPKLRRETKPFRPRGSKYPTLNVPHKIWGEGSYESVGCYNGICYILSGLLPNPTPSQIGATAAYRRLYVPLSQQGDDARLTYTAEVGSNVKVDRYALMQLASLLFALTQDDVALSGNLFTQKPTFNLSQTVVSNRVQARPIQRGQINVYLDTVFADIGTTQVTDVAEERFTLGDKWLPYWAHNTNFPSFKTVTELAPELTFGLKMQHNAQSRAYLDSLVDDEVHYLRIEAIGEQIADNAGTPVYESVVLDAAGKWTQPDDTEEQQTYAFDYNFQALDDEDLGGAFTVEVINLLSAL